jgi:hypothetical protein
MQSAYFFKSAAIVANCESAASKSSTMEFVGTDDIDGSPESEQVGRSESIS